MALDDATVKFEIWDTAGQGRALHLTLLLFYSLVYLIYLVHPYIHLSFRFSIHQERYRSLAPMYYRGAAAAIVVYDITKKDSFNGAKSWVKELQRRGDPNVVIALAGNKADMEGKRKVQTEEAQAYAQENEIIFLETSGR